jgi:2-dehydro-3-deoxy-D-arabinonate dehydratase
LYLPQAKTYDGSCALGSHIVIAREESLRNLDISLNIERGGQKVYEDATNVNQMKRNLPELVEYLTRETSFPRGAFLMTGTGIVPAHPFTLEVGDVINIRVGEVEIHNTVTR